MAIFLARNSASCFECQTQLYMETVNNGMALYNPGSLGLIKYLLQLTYGMRNPATFSPLAAAASDTVKGSASNLI